MSIDAIGNFLTIIRNGLMASRPFVIAPHAKMKLDIARILKQEGFIKDYSVIEQDETNKKSIKVVLNYVEGESVIHEIKRISTPGRRHYTGSQEIEPVIGGLGISILTTNRGIMTNKSATELGVGGEIICTVW